MNHTRPVRLLLACGLAALVLPGCGAEIEDRLLSIQTFHVEFEPSRGDLTPAERAVEADAWRAEVRAVAEQVAQTVSDANVYGDQALWDPILTATNADVTECKFINDSASSLSVTPGTGDEIRGASILAAYLTSGQPTGSPCTTIQSRKVRAFDMIASSFIAGEPTSRIEPLDVRLGTSTSADPWKELDFATLTVTHDASSGTGAAQFAFMVVDKQQGWVNNFEEVLIVTRGSYFGDI